MAVIWNDFNVQGYLIGNPVTDDVFDGNAIVSFAHGMGLIPDKLFKVKTIVRANLKLHHSHITNVYLLYTLDICEFETSSYHF